MSLQICHASGNFAAICNTVQLCAARAVPSKIATLPLTLVQDKLEAGATMSHSALQCSSLRACQPASPCPTPTPTPTPINCSCKPSSDSPGHASNGGTHGTMKNRFALTKFPRQGLFYSGIANDVGTRLLGYQRPRCPLVLCQDVARLCEIPKLEEDRSPYHYHLSTESSTVEKGHKTVPNSE